METKEIIKSAIKKVNLQLKTKNKIKTEKDFIIFGIKSNLDSLTIVNFFLEIEYLCKKYFNKNINILDDKLFYEKSNVKYTIYSLEKDLKKKLKKK